MKKYWQTAWRHKILLIFLIITLGSLVGYLIYASRNQVLPQIAINFLENVRLPSKSQKVLVFSPHPDDESIGAGGFIYDATRVGAEVKIVLVTNGNKHHLEDTRYQEFKSATKILGVEENNLVFWGYPDGRLAGVNQEEIANRIADEIEQFKPDFIIYSAADDIHPDHRTVGRLVEKVLKDENYQGLAYGYLVHFRRFPQPKKEAVNFYLLPPVKVISFNGEWQKLLLDKDTEQTKEKAVDTYKSQLRIPILRGVMLSSIRQNELFEVWK